MIEEKLGYEFKNPRLLDTMRSEFYDALRFLGNKLLMLIFADMLSESHALQEEGVLTTLMQELTGHQRLVPVLAAELGLVDIASKAGRQRVSEQFEAIIGAVWIDCRRNYHTVRAIIHHLLELQDKISFRVESYVNPALADALDAAAVLDFEKRLKYHFRNRFYLLKALTRQSAINEELVSGRVGSFQVYEFMGDRVLGFAIADILIQQTPEVDADFLQQQFVAFTHNAGPLADVAERIRLGRLLIMGRGEKLIFIDSDQKALSDHTEALLGAIWFDSGADYKQIRRFIQHHWAFLGLCDAVDLDATEVAPKSGVLDLASFPLLGDAGSAGASAVGEGAAASAASVPPDGERSYCAVTKTKPPEAFPLPFWQRAAEAKRRATPPTQSPGRSYRDMATRLAERGQEISDGAAGIEAVTREEAAVIATEAFPALGSRRELLRDERSHGGPSTAAISKRNGFTRGL